MKIKSLKNQYTIK